MKTPLPESLFNKVAGLITSGHSEVKQKISKILLTQLMFQSIDLQ